MNRRSILTGFTLILLGILIGTAITQAQTQSKTRITETGIYAPTLNATQYFLENANITDILAYPEQPASYIVFGRDTDGDGVYDIIYAKNGTSGEIEFSGTDASTVIQQAINALPNGKGRILIKNGVYSINQTIYLPRIDEYKKGESFELIGESRFGVKFIVKDVELPDGVLSISGLSKDERAWNIVIRNLVIQPETTPTKTMRGILAKHASFLKIENVAILDFSPKGAGIFLMNVWDSWITNNILQSNGNPDTGEGSLTLDSGLILTGSETSDYDCNWIYIKNNHFDYGKPYSIRVSGWAHRIWICDNSFHGAADVDYGIYGQRLYRSWIVNNNFNSFNIAAIYLALDANYLNIISNTFTDLGDGCTAIRLNTSPDYVSGSSKIAYNDITLPTNGVGIHVYNVRYFVIDGNIIRGSGLRGIYAEYGGAYLNIHGNYIEGPSYALSLQSTGFCTVEDNIFLNAGVVELLDGVTHTVVLGNEIRGTEVKLDDVYDVIIADNLIADATDGIEFRSGTPDIILITDNRFITVTNPIVRTVTPTATVIKRNLGYTTENSGTATITAGSTNVTVSHGLVSTPTVVVANPTTDLGSASYWWVTYNSTHITIHVNADPGKDVTFNWRAEVN